MLEIKMRITLLSGEKRLYEAGKLGYICYFDVIETGAGTSIWMRRCQRIIMDAPVHREKLYFTFVDTMLSLNAAQTISAIFAQVL
jgi:hypothetical protein